MKSRKPVTIRGVEYESMSAAAKALGVNRTVIVSANKRGTLYNVGLGRRGSWKKRSGIRSGMSVDEIDREWWDGL